MKLLLDCAMEIGEMMLISGAEVHRVEDSIVRICHALGAVRTDVFIIPSSMICTVHSSDGDVKTQTRRVLSLRPDYHKLERLNQMSRRICSEGMTYEEIRAELESIRRSKNYSFGVVTLGYAAIAGGFAVFFGGDMRQFLVAVLISLILRFVILFSEKTLKNIIFTKFVSAFTLTALAFLFVRLGFIGRTDEVIIGNIMLLIPGVGFTNALRDLFTGDSIAGIWRCMEALLSALAIAAGYFLFVLITGGVAI